MSYVNSCTYDILWHVWIHINFEFIWSFHKWISWIHMWNLGHQGSRFWQVFICSRQHCKKSMPDKPLWRLVRASSVQGHVQGHVTWPWTMSSRWHRRFLHSFESLPWAFSVSRWEYPNTRKELCTINMTGTFTRWLVICCVWTAASRTKKRMLARNTSSSCHVSFTLQPVELRICCKIAKLA